MIRFFSFAPISPVAVLAFLFPIFFLTIKGWTNTFLFILAIYSLFLARHDFSGVFRGRSKLFWTFFACLIFPFISELMAHLGRGEIILASLDGPSRSILAALIFAVLSRAYSGPPLSRLLVLGAIVSICVTTISVALDKSHYWGDRAATYFVDPITLPCFLVSLLGVILMHEFQGWRVARRSYLIKVICLVFVAYVALESSSRSSWVALILLVELFILVSVGPSFRGQLKAHTVLIFTALCIFFLNDRVNDRVTEASKGVIEWTSGGGQDKSSAQRLVMFEIDIELIKRAPWFGRPDGEMPSFDSLHSEYPSLNEEIHYIKRQAGSHSEYTAQLVRKGLPLGALCLFSVFIYPLAVFVRGIISGRREIVEVSAVGLGFVIPIIFSALTIQVFNLKMTTSFYQLVLTILFCDLYRLLGHRNN